MALPFRLEGYKALVTGGASGIGEAICRVFHNAGASVVVADINTAQEDALSSQLAGSSALVCDVTSETSVREAIGSLDRLDVLVNHAGMGFVGNIEEPELTDFQRLFRVNVE